MKSRLRLMTVAVSVAVGLSWIGLPSVAAQQNDISGVVTSGDGSEAGVWVIAETDDRRASRCWLEGTRRLDDLRRGRDLTYRGRKGCEAGHPEVPGST